MPLRCEDKQRGRLRTILHHAACLRLLSLAFAESAKLRPSMVEGQLVQLGTELKVTLYSCMQAL